MSVILKNTSGGLVTLPPRYGGFVLKPGLSYIINDTEANIGAALGDDYAGWLQLVDAGSSSATLPTPPTPATPANVGTAAAVGSNYIPANSDHVHDLPESVLRTVAAELTAALAVNSQKITGLATPTASTDAATKGYVDSVAQGLDIKGSCVAASTADIDLAVAADPNPIDGVTVTDGQRVLLKDQSTGAQNGIYVAATAIDPTTWTRATDMAAGSSAAGNFAFIESGTANGDAGFVCTNATGAAVVGTDALVFTQFSGAGQITAGNGLTKSGNTLAAGAGPGIAVSADAIGIDSAKIARVSATPAAEVANVVAVVVQLQDLAGASVNAARRLRLGVFDDAAGFYAGTPSATAAITLTGGGDGAILAGSGAAAAYAETDAVNGQLDIDVTDATGGAFTRLLYISDSGEGSATFVLPMGGVTLTWDA